MSKIPKGMIPCRVEQLPYGPWIVTFPDRSQKSLFLQIDHDQAAFGVSCGAIRAKGDWNGTVEALGQGWDHFDPEAIRSCPDTYSSVARPPTP